MGEKIKRHPSYKGFLSTQLETRGWTLKQYYDDSGRGWLYCKQYGRYQIYILPRGFSNRVEEERFDITGFGLGVTDVVRYFNFAIYKRNVIDAISFLELAHLNYT